MNTSPENILITDSGYWIALFNHTDALHPAAARASERHSQHRFAITQAVITEATHMLWRRGYGRLIEPFLDMLGGEIIQIWNPTQSQMGRTIQLMRKYRDLPMDYADASLVLLAEHLGHGRILTTDQRDFGTYRWKNHYPFESVLEEDTE